VDHLETPSPQEITQHILTSDGKIIPHDHSSPSRHEAVPPASWIEISKDNLKLMEADKFKFDLESMLSGFPAKVDKPEDYPEKVTTESAKAYLMSTKAPYTAEHHLPNQAQKKKIIYYELQDIPDDWGTQGNIWFGFSRFNARAPPGSGPGSFGINRVEGNLYYNGIPVGKPRKHEFDSGAKIGIGIVFSYVDKNSDLGSDSTIEVRVFQTRQGLLIDDIPVDTLDGAGQDGFDGYHDLFATIGTVDRVVFEVSFEEKFWSFKPGKHNL
jgi:hypothetical protein